MSLRPVLAAVLVLVLGFGAASLAHAQSALVNAGDFQADRERIAAQRQALEQQAQAEATACYQRFAVQDCLSESRKRRRAQTDDLRRQEAAINDIERKRRGAEQLRRLDEKQAMPRTQDQPDVQAQARQAQRDREQRAADHAQSRAATAAEAAQRKQDFSNKQSHHAQDEAKAAERRAQVPVEQDRFQRKQAAAERRRAERERRNAEQNKAPAAPLPAPVR